jgi:hypothetical protein
MEKPFSLLFIVLLPDQDGESRDADKDEQTADSGEPEVAVKQEWRGFFPPLKASYAGDEPDRDIEHKDDPGKQQHPVQ